MRWLWLGLVLGALACTGLGYWLAHRNHVADRALAQRLIEGMRQEREWERLLREEREREED